ncbi:MAG: DMT family transporter [Spirochaetota bacterium]
MVLRQRQSNYLALRNMLNLKQKSLLQVHIAALLLGFVPLLVKYMSTPLIVLVSGRALFTAISLGLLILLKRDSFRLHSLRDFLLLSFLGVIQALQWLSFFQAVEMASVAIALVSLFTFPLFISILEPVFFEEDWNTTHLLSSLVILTGISMLVPEANLKNQTTVGVVWGLLAALLAASLFLFDRKYTKKYSGSQISFYESTLACITLAPFFIQQEYSIPALEWVYIAILGVFCTALPYVLLINSMKGITAQQASSIMSLEIVYGSLFAFFILQEIPSVRTIIGGGLIFSVALYLTMSVKKNAEN